jgi:hypothetical protein
LYYTDCRSSCSSGDLANATAYTYEYSGTILTTANPKSAFGGWGEQFDGDGNGREIPVCCDGVPVTSVELSPQIYNLKELEAEMNSRIFNASGVSSLVRLEMDYLAISRGVSRGMLLNQTTIELNIQFGGFIFHLYDPGQKPPGSLEEMLKLSKMGRLGFCDEQRFMAAFVPTFIPSAQPHIHNYCRDDSRNVGAMLGFLRVEPSISATQCQNPNENPNIDGGCYSNFARRAERAPDTLITKFEGEISSAACEAFCPKGFYSDDGVQKIGQECLLCNSGNYTDLIGSTGCKHCSPGSYSGDVGPYPECFRCERGKSQRLAASTGCTFCAVGAFSPFTGASTCHICQPGTYSLTTGAATSFGVAQGTFALLAASNHSSTVVNALPDTCLECPSGKVSSSLGSTSCASCHPGYVAIGAGLSSCSHCHPGHYSDVAGASVCEGCAPGSRSERPSSSTG